MARPSTLPASLIEKIEAYIERFHELPQEVVEELARRELRRELFLAAHQGGEARVEDRWQRLKAGDWKRRAPARRPRRWFVEAYAKAKGVSVDEARAKLLSLDEEAYRLVLHDARLRRLAEYLRDHPEAPEAEWRRVWEEI
ncbi:MAG: hypothetical protein D6771_01375 [Zetaproteobacteria bacterium]|nr:MAG: hypothetical protein D6771_01375 [Zetaproteobacteria bacterium]